MAVSPDYSVGRDFTLRDVPSCGFNQLRTTVKHDRQLETQLDKFFDLQERRHSHGSVYVAVVGIHCDHTH